MKSLQESLLDNEEELFNRTDAVSLIEDFLKENYSVYNKDGGPDSPMNYKIYKKNGKWYVDVDCVYLTFLNKNEKHLTGGLFQFGTVGDFSKSTYSWNTRGFKIAAPNKLEDLTGAPKEIIGDLDCSHCDHLKSLKGCPKYIDRYLKLNFCPNLKDIKDLKKVKKVGWAIFIRDESNFKEEDIRKYVPETVCNRVYGKF